MDSLVEFEYLGADRAIAVARMVREKPLNSLLLDTIDQLAEKIYAWLDDDNISCIILDSSSEKAFCAGADIKEMQSKTYMDTYSMDMFGIVDRITNNIHKPIIAAVNGFALGGGCELAMTCDIIIEIGRAHV